MSQSNKFVLIVLLLWVVFTTQKGHLSQYIKILWG